MRAKSASVRWHEWLLLALAVLPPLFAIQDYTALLMENEPRAAGMLLVMFGLEIVAGSLVWF